MKMACSELSGDGEHAVFCSKVFARMSFKEDGVWNRPRGAQQL